MKRGIDSVRTCIGHKEVFGCEYPLGELLATLRRVAVGEWLYVASWVDLTLERGSTLDPSIQMKIIQAVFKGDSLRTAVLASATHRAPLFHQLTSLVLTRLALYAGIPSNAGQLASLGDVSEVGRVLLACSDIGLDPLTEPILEVDENDRSAREAALLDYTLRTQDLFNREGLRNALIREHSLLFSLPEEIDAATHKRVQDALAGQLGMPLLDFFSVGFAFYHCNHEIVIGPGPDPSLYFDPFAFMENIAGDRAKKEAFLRRFSAKLNHAQENAKLADPGTIGFSANFEWLEKWPSIEMPDGRHVVPVHSLLARRFTRGLYPFLRNLLISGAKDKVLADDFTRLRSRAAEVYVERAIGAALSNRGVVHGKIPYRAKDGNRVFAEDVVATFGKDHSLLIFEVKSGALRRDTKAEGSMDHLFEGGAVLDDSLRTLSRVVGDIRSGLCSPEDLLLNRFRWTVPITVSYEHYHFNYLLRRRLDREAAARGLSVSNRVPRVALLSFEEIELAEALEDGGDRFPVLLLQWLSDPTESAESFMWFVQRRRPQALNRATERMLKVLDRVWADMVRCLGLKQ